MADRLRVAFWNVENLFEVNVVSRGPRSSAELVAKLDRLSECIDAFFGGHGPDVLGLAEVNTDRLVQELEGRLQHRYAWVWEPPGMPTQTGLAALARIDRISALDLTDVCRPSQFARPRCILTRLHLKGTAEPILFAVNHWKSNLPPKDPAAPSPAKDQEETARWLRDWLASSDRDTCAVIVGDFNAEPMDRPFGDFQLPSRRHFSSALWSQATPAYLYNTAWRFLAEPLLWDNSMASAPVVNEPRPKRTHVGANTIWDQLMVSGRALRNGPIQLREDTVDYHRDSRNSEHNARGVLRPVRWAYDASTAQFEGASDHYPLVAEFEVH